MFVERKQAKDNSIKISKVVLKYIQWDLRSGEINRKNILPM
jgi:hypothetical protein